MISLAVILGLGPPLRSPLGNIKFINLNQNQHHSSNDGYHILYGPRHMRLLPRWTFESMGTRFSKEAMRAGSPLKPLPRPSTKVSLCNFVFNKKNYSDFHGICSSAVECADSDRLCPGSNLQQLSFCWSGICARDLFKLSEAKWRELPWPLSETLLTTSYSVREVER